MAHDTYEATNIPHSLELERAVLGFCLLDNALFNQIASLKLTDFYAPAHQRIFAVMRDLAADGQLLDPLVVGEALKREGQLASVGGQTGVSNLTYGLPYQTRIDHYVREMKALAARRFALKALHAMQTEIMEGVSLAQLCDDLTSLESQLRQSHPTETRSFKPLSEVLELEVMPVLDAYFRREVSEFLIPTGFAEIDEILGGGLYLSDMMAIVAPPKSAKSAFALQLALSLAAREPVALLSLEMSNVQNGLRFIVQQAFQTGRATGRAADAIDASWLRPELYESTYRQASAAAAELMARAQLYLCQLPLTWREVQAETRRMVKERGVRVLIVDYWQLVVNDRRGVTRAEALAEVAKGLKALGQELNICVIALGQFNQEGLRQHAAGKELNTLYLEGSGELVKSANIVLTLDIAAADLAHRDAPRAGKLIFRPLRSAADAQLECVFLGQYLTVEIGDA